jgi:hypothetical protein
MRYLVVAPRGFGMSDLIGGHARANNEQLVELSKNTPNYTLYSL